MNNKYLKAHIERIVESSKNLWKQPNSICHKCHDMEDVYCLFCYCPLYYEDECGGDYIILPNGIKDCSECSRPHTREFCVEQLMKIYER